MTKRPVGSTTGRQADRARTRASSVAGSSKKELGLAASGVPSAATTPRLPTMVPPAHEAKMEPWSLVTGTATSDPERQREVFGPLLPAGGIGQRGRRVPS